MPDPNSEGRRSALPRRHQVSEKLRTLWMLIQKEKRHNSPSPHPLWDAINMLPEVIAVLDDASEFEADAAAEEAEDRKAFSAPDPNPDDKIAAAVEQIRQCAIAIDGQYANDLNGADADSLRGAADLLSRLVEEVGRLTAERDAHAIYFARIRARWDADPLMKRLDRVRANIAGLRPGDAEAIAEHQERTLITEASLASVEKEREEAKPVAWRVKDFADGWILCHNEAEALREADCGNAVQPLYAKPHLSAPVGREALIALLDEWVWLAPSQRDKLTDAILSLLSGAPNAPP